MTFPKPEAGVQLRGKVNGELLSAGSAEHPGKPRRYLGVLRHKGSPRWTCYHRHETSSEARLCAAAELGRWLKARV